jgi:DNA-binding transcriptional LysR family regulator
MLQMRKPTLRTHFNNLSIEAMRIVADLDATRSASRTAQNLGVTAAAVDYHLTKLEDILGGPLFERYVGGYRATAVGAAAINYAQKIIHANDQIVLLSTRSTEARPLRIGLNNIFVNAFFDYVVTSETLKQLRISCETSFILERMLREDQLDLAVLCPGDTKKAFTALAEWTENFVWCKSPSLILSPGAPVPVLGFVDCALTSLALRTLEINNRLGEMVFTSMDRHALKKAAKAGAGVWPIRPGPLDPMLVVLDDEELPPLPPLFYGVYAKSEFVVNAHRQRVIEMLARLSPDSSNGTTDR